MGTQNKSGRRAKRAKVSAMTSKDFEMECRPPSVEQGGRIRLEISARDTTSKPFDLVHEWRVTISGMVDQKGGAACMVATFKNECTLVVNLACNLGASLGLQQIKIHKFAKDAGSFNCSGTSLEYSSTNKPMTIT